jgi:hypothetical protein
VILYSALRVVFCSARGWIWGNCPYWLA